MMSDLPRLALSIQQPWAFLIVSGRKDVENRSWSTRIRGRILIHAGKSLDFGCLIELDEGRHPVTNEKIDWWVPTGFSRGGIVGEAEIVDCVTSSNSPWFSGRYGFVLRNARPLPFRPCNGRLGFFEPTFERAE